MHLSGWNFNSHISDHCSSLTRSFWRVSASALSRRVIYALGEKLTCRRRLQVVLNTRFVSMTALVGDSWCIHHRFILLTQRARKHLFNCVMRTKDEFPKKEQRVGFEPTNSTTGVAKHCNLGSALDHSAIAAHEFNSHSRLFQWKFTQAKRHV